MEVILVLREELKWSPLFNLSFSLSILSSSPVSGEVVTHQHLHVLVWYRHTHTHTLLHILYPCDLTVWKMNIATLFCLGFVLRVHTHENTHRHAPLPQRPLCFLPHYDIHPPIPVTSRGQQRHFTLPLCWALFCMQECAAGRAGTSEVRKKGEKYREREIPRPPGCKTIRL